VTRPSTQPSRAKTAHQARQTRSHRGPADTHGASRQIADWLQPGRGRPPGPPPPSAAGGTAAVLRDGSVVLIRQVRAADAPLLADIFAQLSPTSRWMRFLAAKSHLTEAELRYLTDIDHHDHEAFAALDASSGRGLGVARYIRHATDPRAAELAIAVADAWHGQGLGTQLLTRLSVQARRAGIHRLTALTAASNTAMHGLLHGLGAELITGGPDTVEYQLSLTSWLGQPSHEIETK